MSEGEPDRTNVRRRLLRRWALTAGVLGLAAVAGSAMARQSTVTNAEAAVDYARAHVPDIQIEACEGTHSLPFEQPERISACLTEFMDAHDPAAAG